MKKSLVILAGCAVLVLCAVGLCYCGGMDIGSLVDDFSKATDLQRAKILEDNIGKDISAAGVVTNAGEYDFFDIVNDIKGMYYQVATEVQKSNKNIPYQVVFLFKDRDKVRNIDKGQRVQKDGKIIRILDERLQITVWLLCGDLTDSDKALFKSDLGG